MEVLATGCEEQPRCQSEWEQCSPHKPEGADREFQADAEEAQAWTTGRWDKDKEALPKEEGANPTAGVAMVDTEDTAAEKGMTERMMVQDHHED